LIPSPKILPSLESEGHTTSSAIIKHSQQTDTKDSTKSKARGTIKTEEVTITPDGTRTTKSVWKTIGEDGETHITRTEERIEYMPRSKVKEVLRPTSSDEENREEDQIDLSTLRSTVSKRATQPEKTLSNIIKQKKVDDPELKQERNIRESKTKSWFWDW